MHLQSALEQLGYTPNQVKIYLASLRMGASTITQIANRVGMPRSTASETAEDLHRRGILSYYLKHRRKYWTAEDPAKLSTILQNQQTIIAQALPLLNAIALQASNNDPHIRCYIGNSDVKQIFDDIVASKHHIQSLANWDDVLELFGTQFIGEFIDRRIARFLKMDLISVKSEVTKNLKSRDVDQLRHTRFLPENASLHKILNYIYGNKTAIIALAKKNPVGIIIDDADVSRTMRLYFEALWRYCTET